MRHLPTQAHCNVGDWLPHKVIEFPGGHVAEILFLRVRTPRRGYELEVIGVKPVCGVHVRFYQRMKPCPFDLAYFVRRWACLDGLNLFIHCRSPFQVGNQAPGRCQLQSTEYAQCTCCETLSPQPSLVLPRTSASRRSVMNMWPGLWVIMNGT